MERFKKLLPFFLVGLFISWASYKFFIERPIKPKNETFTLDWHELEEKSGVKKNPLEQVPLSIKTNNTKEASDKVSVGSRVDDQEIFLAFDEVERNWLLAVKPVIGEEYYSAYLELREKNEKEKMDAYKAYHEFLRQKYGDNFEYNISEDQSVKEKEINQVYLKKLLELLGRERFQNYLKARDEYNEGTRRSGKEFLPMEF